MFFNFWKNENENTKKRRRKERKMKQKNKYKKRKNSKKIKKLVQAPSRRFPKSVPVPHYVLQMGRPARSVACAFRQLIDTNSVKKIGPNRKCLCFPFNRKKRTVLLTSLTYGFACFFFTSIYSFLCLQIMKIFMNLK